MDKFIVHSCISLKYSKNIISDFILKVQHITTATLVWLWSRHDLRQSLVPIIASMLLFTVYRSLISEFLVTSFTIGPWSTLFIKAITAVLMGSVTLHIYAALAYSIGIF